MTTAVAPERGLGDISLQERLDHLADRPLLGEEDGDPDRLDRR
jgi:hypothetical protein